MDMNTDAMTGAMDGMDQSGLAMSTDWGVIGDHVTTLTGQLGQGPLGTAYLAGLPREVADTVAAVGRHCQQPGALAAVGHQCAQLYGGSEQHASDALDAVEAAPVPPADPRRA